MATIQGVTVRVHMSFLFVAGWFMVEGVTRLHSEGPIEIVAAMGLSVACYGLPLLIHELGHFLAALLARVRPKELTLYPFGLSSRVTSDISPSQENIVRLGGLFASALFQLALLRYPIGNSTTTAGIYNQLSLINAALLVLNLLPFHPLDGARVWKHFILPASSAGAARSWGLLHYFGPLALAALAIAAENVPLTIISVVLITRAGSEYAADKARTILQDFKASDLMVPAAQLLILSHGKTIFSLAADVLNSFQPYFPVTHAGKFLGVVEREKLLNEYSAASNAYIGSIAEQRVPQISSAEAAPLASRILLEDDQPLLAVLDEDQFKGIIFRDKLLEFLMVHHLHHSAHAQEPGEEDF